MKGIPEWMWRGVNALAVHSLFHTANAFDLMRHRPSERHVDVEVARDLPYDGVVGEHAAWRRLDVWRPARRGHDEPLPAILFIHGGGFRTMSKRTHWYFARAFARMGFVVFSIDYRLAPDHPFPAAIEDACLAWSWVCRNAHAHGADPTRIVLAGESAGGNLVTALTLATCTRRDEPWAQRAFDEGIVPVATMPLCGILQVSDTERYARAGASIFVMPALRDATSSYLGDAPGHDMADPLVALEQGPALERRLPPFFAAVGTSDPLIDDTRRLEVALKRTHTPCTVHTYAGGAHSFMAFMWTAKAQRCWKDMRDFLDRRVPKASPTQPR